MKHVVIVVMKSGMMQFLQPISKIPIGMGIKIEHEGVILEIQNGSGSEAIGLLL